MTSGTDLASVSAQIRELTDRAELGDLFERYLITPDEDRFELEWLRTIFTEDVSVRYPGGAGHDGLDGLAMFGTQAMAQFDRTHHVTSNHLIDLGGDRASVRANLVATHVHSAADPWVHFVLGGYYAAEAIRTPEGWRFRELALHLVWTRSPANPSGAPDAPSPASTPAELMALLDEQLRSDPSRTETIDAVFEFVLEGEHGGTWWIEARDGTGAVHSGAPAKCDVTVRMLDAVFVRLWTTDLDGTAAYFDGLMTVEGDQSKVMHLAQIFGE